LIEFTECLVEIVVVSALFVLEKM